ncbi:MAG: hypothetical protein V1835_06055, partial [Candidatus Micrarchaeota archaeon]
MKKAFFAIFIACIFYAQAITPITNCNTALSAAGETYILQNDVTADGKCFIISANGITLDLNGKTVTFDNAPPVNAANRGFE